MTSRAALLAIALLATWPLARDPFDRMIGHEDVDVWNHAWGLWWFWDSLDRGVWPWRTEWLGAPDGGVLWFIDPIGGLLGAPLVPLVGVVGAWNAVIFAYVALAAAGAAAIARRLGGDGPHVYVASVAVAFGPYLLSELFNGISEVVNLGPALFAVAAALDAFDRRDDQPPGAGAWIRLALWLMVATTGSFYYGFAAGVVVAGLGVAWLIRGPSPRGLGAAGAVAAVAGGWAWALKGLIESSLDGAALISRQSEAMAPRMRFHNAVDPRTYLWPDGFQSRDLFATGEAFLHSGYVGWLVLVLAAWGASRTRRWALLAGALALLVFGLGPWLFFDGAWVLAGDQKVPLPWAALSAVLPPQAMTHSLRLAGPGLAILAAFAAAACAGRRWVWAAIPLVWLDMVALGGAPWPLPATPKLDTAAHAWLGALARGAGDAQPAAVLDLPGAVSSTMATSRYLVLQATHRLPIPYRPNARASQTSLIEDPTFQLLAVASEYRPASRRELIHALSKRLRLDRQALARYGIGWVVVHRELERGSEKIELTETLLRAMYGEPEVIGTHAIYTVSGEGSAAFSSDWRPVLLTLPDAQREIRDARRAEWRRVGITLDPR